MEMILSSGARYALDLGSLQGVPELGVPVRRADSEMIARLLGHLSFEHPFG